MEHVNQFELIDIIAEKAKAIRKPGDYEEDGLLYCGNCKTPKQGRLSIGNRVRIVACQCSCAAKQYVEEQGNIAAEQKRIRIERLRSDGIRDKSLVSCSFETSFSTPELEKLRNYAERWPEMEKKNIGLLLWGNTGNGKTFGAACVANQLIDNGVPVMITSFPRILNSAFDKQDIVEQMHYYPLVVIDDLGAERQSDYALETVYMVIDERYKAKKPLIITTNLTLDEICKPKNMKLQRIYDRVLEMCSPIAFKGESIRRVKARENAAAAAKMLTDTTKENGNEQP